MTTSTLAELADAVAAFVEGVAGYQYEHSLREYDEGYNFARNEVADKARALLAGLEEAGNG